MKNENPDADIKETKFKKDKKSCRSIKLTKQSSSIVKMYFFLETM